ncbi:MULTISPECIES: hypothetical protein [unclassified Pseudoxanthomonas]|uniref:hypothetical protein n=1 Tax=unclassified Pseudoxanthomonas TaxID=2645906 RepID=UPI00161DBE11|nr:MULTISPECIES: hypothetical protein [unclassified Pseudoxanthomonas]MBB3277425.1 hypothetical protein [Pseudoxanthomonas sp. OG2]MBV7474098.1 hypothetical protein [Pseudoxanthomonas sp. PXM05]
MRYSYQAEKLSSARHALMLPHSLGEAQSIADAFHEISLALHQLDVSKLNESAKRWIAILQGYMDTTGVSDPDSEGAWVVKARTFTTDDQIRISTAVDELAHWFDYEEGT